MKRFSQALLRHWPVPALLAVAVPLLWPLFAPGLLVSVDGTIHLLRISALGRMIDSGVLFPRWMPEMLLGGGYPLFTYYAAGTYYVAFLLDAIGLAPAAAFQVTLALLALATGFGTLALALDLFGGRKAPSFVAAAAAMASPYLLLNVYTRGALAEVGAQALLPWILWSSRRVLRSDSHERDAITFALLLACLAVTHTLSLLIVPPLLVGWLLLQAWFARTAPDFRLRLWWTLGSLAAAMGLSAFFWLPLLLERGYLATTGLEIAREVWLPQSVWKWANAVQSSWRYNRMALRPAQMGLAQVLLGASGFIAGLFYLRHRRTERTEWLFLGAVALVAALLVGEWSLGLWQSSLASVVQFPWRLLLIISVPLALLAGGLILALADRHWSQQGAAVALVLTALVLAHAPLRNELQWIAPEGVRTDADVLALSEGAMGAAEAGEWHSPVQEFRPRWAPTELILPEDLKPDVQPADLTIDLLERSVLGLRLRVSSPVTATIHLADLYFPGRATTLDDTIRLELRPVTPLGLLGFDVPPGTHEVSVVWTGTRLQQGAGALSLITAIVLILYWTTRGRRKSALVAGALFVLLAVWSMWPRPPRTFDAPTQAVDNFGLRLSAVRLDSTPPETARVFVAWQVKTRPPADLSVAWRLAGADGVITTWTSRPYYNLSDASQWPPGTLVDDVYSLALPDGLLAGSYRVSARLTVPGGPAGEFAEIGEFTLASALPSAPSSDRALDVGFGSTWRLAGLDGNQPTVLRPGQTFQSTLHWRLLEFPIADAHTFVHLVDANGKTLAQSDHAPGPLNMAPLTLLPGRTWLDPHTLRIPADAPSGLYWPTLGIFDKESGERLAPVAGEASHGAMAGSGEVTLEPIKVLNPPRRAAGARVDARLGTFARLETAAVSAPAVPAPGAPVTVTLFFAAVERTASDYTRFIHLIDVHGALVTQSDQQPAGGLNPTSAWVPGELVVDRAILEWPAPPPECPCTLLAGLYLPNGERAAAFDSSGAPIADSAVPIWTLTGASR